MFVLVATLAVNCKFDSLSEESTRRIFSGTRAPRSATGRFQLPTNFVTVVSEAHSTITPQEELLISYDDDFWCPDDDAEGDDSHCATCFGKWHGTGADEMLQCSGANGSCSVSRHVGCIPGFALTPEQIEEALFYCPDHFAMMQAAASLSFTTALHSDSQQLLLPRSPSHAARGGSADLFQLTPSPSQSIPSAPDTSKILPASAVRRSLLPNFQGRTETLSASAAAGAAYVQSPVPNPSAQRKQLSTRSPIEIVGDGSTSEMAPLDDQTQLYLSHSSQPKLFQHLATHGYLYLRDLLTKEAKRARSLLQSALQSLGYIDAETPSVQHELERLVRFDGRCRRTHSFRFWCERVQDSFHVQAVPDVRSAEAARVRCGA
jgi:hypothetical protein